MQASTNFKKMLSNYHYSDLHTITNCEGEVLIFQVTPKYGGGQEVLVRVIDGLYVTYTNCCISQQTTKNTDNYHGIICMYQLFEGEAQINFKNNSAFMIKKNDIVNFAGNAEFEGNILHQSNFASVGLLCYYDELINSLAALNLDTTKLMDYYHEVSSHKEVLIYNSDVQFSAISKQLKEAVLENNMFLVKAKALEMLYCGITNYAKYKNVSKRKYNRQYLEQVSSVKAQIDKNPQEAYLIYELAECCGMCPTYFKKIFRELFGIQPHRYIVQKRLEKSKEMLVKYDLNISDISETLGFTSSSRFAETFKKEYGYLPSQYRKTVKKQ